MINKIKELTNKLNKYRDEYYNGNNPSVSDAEYDRLFDELAMLEEKYRFSCSNSPTKTVGYEVKSGLQKVTHSSPMLSLDKTKNTMDLVKFAGKQDILCSLKLDGLTIRLSYKDGKLVLAETRGNGEIGEDVTHNAKVFDNVPLIIPIKKDYEIEGEAIITYSDFEEINSHLVGEQKYKNPRNLASGSVRQLDSKIAAKRHIRFFAWKDPNASDYSDGLVLAKTLGFDVVPHIIYSGVHDNADYINHVVGDLKHIAEENLLPIDGIVATYVDHSYGKSLGVTGHHPRHSIAFKFADDTYETTLRDIQWQVGKTGQLTPVAIFDEVDIDGSIVSKASVHNVSILTELNLHEGDTIQVIKANMVIPQVVANLCDDMHKDDYVKIPGTCPICGATTKIVQANESKVLMCTNDKCAGKRLGKLCHFVSRDAMNIDGMSEATLERFIEAGYITSITSIYRLSKHADKIKRMDGFGVTSTKKLLDAIEKSKKTTFDRLLFALSIPMVGKTTAKLIANDITINSDKPLDYLEFIVTTRSYAYWMGIDGIGSEIAKSFHNYMKNNWSAFKSLYEMLDVFTEKKAINDKLAGKVFAITGSVKNFVNRDELKNKIEALGGKVTGSVSKTTSFLINNDNMSSSSKNVKAKQLGVKIITENDFLEMIK